MKVFISQPMNGRSDKAILDERKEIATTLRKNSKYSIDIIESFVPNVDPNSGPLYYLGRSISLLAAADAIYFAPQWYNSRGCRIEYDCAKEYGIPILELSKLKGERQNETESNHS
jgi:hypothetical protein